MAAIRGTSSDAGQPKVSVSIICYNQERYIEECLESVLAQEAPFPIEIVVGDDGSQDQTQAILKDYQAKYPSIIHPILHEKNVGPTRNFYDVTIACSGEYIAHIDGDDRMLPGKLLKQANFLDSHPNCSMVVHKVRVFQSRDGKQLGYIPHVPHPEISDIAYLASNYQFFVASSKMYRRSANRFPRRMTETVDLLYHFEHASIGHIGYLEEVLGEYRKVENSMSDPQSAAFAKSIQGSLDSYARALELGVSPQIVDKGLRKFKAGIAMFYLEAGKPDLFKEFIEHSAAKEQYIGIRHRILYTLRNNPRAAQLLYRAYKPMQSFIARLT